MNHETVYVVGNVFKNVINEENIFTFDQTLEIAKNGCLDVKNLSFEQGISEKQLGRFQKIIKMTNNKKPINLITYFDKHKRCPAEFSHKVKSYNTLISDPEQLDDNYYKSLLMIDERCAELSDHVTGKHIQFMILVEAARQMVNAVTEKYYASDKKIYLANDLKTLFKTFVYPFRTELVYQITETKMKINGNGKMSIQIDFMQWGKSVCSFDMSFTILDRNFVSSLEEASLPIHA